MTSALVPEWMWDPMQGADHGVRVPLARIFAFGQNTPDKVVLHDGETTLTAGQLETVARGLALRFKGVGVAPGKHVVVLSEKRTIVPAVIGAIWKAGAVYVPIDAHNPSERLLAQMRQLDIGAVIAAAATLTKVSAIIGSTPHFTFEEVTNLAVAEAAEDLPLPEIAGNAPAYVIFTSGSTGAPKGVVISHDSLLDYFSNHNHVLRLTPDSRVLSLAPFHFDVSIEDTVLPLSLGAFVWQYRGAQVGPAMRGVLRRGKITHLIAVSSLLALLSDNGRHVRGNEFPDLEMVMTGAEVCDPRLIDAWVTQLPFARIINAYGPTEATIVCLTHTIERPEPDRVDTYPIGGPLPRVEIRVVGENGEVITCTGEAGELWIGGSQIMIGYLGRPEDTATACPVRDGRRWYRTGDLVRYDIEGRISNSKWLGFGGDLWFSRARLSDSRWAC